MKCSSRDFEKRIVISSDNEKMHRRPELVGELY